jgi:superoxide dismutase, Fe-Mn family
MLEAKKFASIRELKGISEKTLIEHYALYEAYVKKVNEIMEKLQTADKSLANATFSDWRSLKVEMSFALNGVKSHELYFGHLGGQGGEPKGKLAELIRRDFGSFDEYRDDLAATAMAARGWAWTAYDWQVNKLFNFIGDAHNTYPIWHATPLVALDVYEHAYWMDFGRARVKYIQAFFDNLNWQPAEEAVEKMQMK